MNEPVEPGLAQATQITDASKRYAAGVLKHRLADCPGEASVAAGPGLDSCQGWIPPATAAGRIGLAQLLSWTSAA